MKKLTKLTRQISGLWRSAQADSDANGQAESNQAAPTRRALLLGGAAALGVLAAGVSLSPSPAEAHHGRWRSRRWRRRRRRHRRWRSRRWRHRRWRSRRRRRWDYDPGPFYGPPGIYLEF